MAIKAKEIKESKKQAVKTIKEKIDRSKLLILTDYRGMTVKQVTELKRNLRKEKAEYKVYKNTLVVKSLPESLSSLEEKLLGPIAIVFGYEDVAMPAKALFKFISDNEKPKVIGGVVESEICHEGKIKDLSKLPSKIELLAKVIGGMKSPLYNLVSVLHGPLRKFVYVLDAVKKQGGEK